MKRYIYTIVAFAAMLASCSQDAELNEVIDNQPMDITQVGATTWAATRAAVDATDNTIVNWQAGDALSVFSSTSASGGSKFTTTSTRTAGIFNIVADQPTISAVTAMMYPYQATATWDNDNSKLTCEIPSVQSATKGSFDKAAAIMYNIGSDTEPTLTYAVNFLKVTVNEGNVHSICISSSKELSGKMEITSNAISPVSGSSLNSVVLVAPANKVLEPGDYYIAIKKGDILSPEISYTYYNTANHTATVKTKAGSSTISFSSGKNVKLISVDFSKGSVTSRNAVQLWTDGPYFAQFNVGATITDYSEANKDYSVSDNNNTADLGGIYCWGGLTDFRYEGSTGDYYSGSIVSGFVLPIYNDVASVFWGSNWEIPTNNCIQKLFTGILNYNRNFDMVESVILGIPQEGTYVDWTWCNGSTVQYVTGCTLSGFKISGKDDYVGNNIFIPFTGARDPNLTYTYNNHRFASYWFSTCEDNTTYPQFFSFRRSSGGIPHIEIYWQHFEYATEALYGRAIRAVLK